jgi:hypothetical protein
MDNIEQAKSQMRFRAWIEMVLIPIMREYWRYGKKENK